MQQSLVAHVQQLGRLLAVPAGALERVLDRQWILLPLMLLLGVRMFTSVLSYGSGVPGGIFAPPYATPVLYHLVRQLW